MVVKNENYGSRKAQYQCKLISTRKSSVHGVYLYKTLRDVIGRDAPQRLWDENVEDPTDPAEQEPTGMAIVLETEPAEHDEVLNVVILDAPPEV